MNKRHTIGAGAPRRQALAAALAISLGFTGVAYGQATTGSIFGTAPIAAGETVKVVGTAGGTTRVVSVDNSGKFNVGNLPVGTYTVTLMSGDKVVATQDGVAVSPGGGTAVPFVSGAAANAKEAQNLGAIQVVANAMPPIDVTSVNSSTIITARDLQQLPVGRNAESIALLAPSTTKGSGYFGNTVSFGGSSVSENAYYVNGYNTGEPYKNIGGFSLPYGSIDQQQTLTGGYSAKYGRSDGGVINQIGKRGTNEWHFGGQLVWQPAFARSSSDNVYYGYPAIPAPNGGGPYVYNNPTYPGTLAWYRRPDSQWQTVYSAYAGGPLIKDRLYMFVAAETTRTQNQYVYSQATTSTLDDYRDTSNKYYAKLDWNINESNTIELTGLQNNETDGRGKTYNYNYNNLTKGAFKGTDLATKDNARFYIGQYTGYYGDNATLSVLYGRARFDDPTLIGGASPLPFISHAENQCLVNCGPGSTTLPAGNNAIHSDQLASTVGQGENAHNATHGLRVDFTYKLGDHNLGVGIDNMHYAGINQGVVTTGPGYFWRYFQTPNADGTRTYTVRKYVETFQTTMSTSQKAYYLQDEWQVAQNVQLNLGVRNDHFTNYNNHGVAFVDEKNQWEPRLGVSWDVNGDSSFKVYANAGRYYLALPDNAAERAANPSTYTDIRYTYTGVNPDGTPQGIVPINGGPLLSPDGEFGAPKDPKQVTAANLKPEYLDEYILGFDKQLNEKWVYGAKATWRNLKSAIDDECSPGQIAAKMTAMGLNTADYSDSLYGASYCRLINPGQTNDLRVLNSVTGQYTIVSMTQKDWGYIHGVRRTYGSLDMYLDHPWDGKWTARVDYEFNVGRGNTEGQVRSDFGQGDVSKTEDWDSWQLMQGQDGELLNVRRHQLRFRGAYAITPEWLLSGTAMIQSGAPEECLGWYGPNGTDDPSGYNNPGGNYHWCGGQIVSPGFKHTPWTHQYNIGVHYSPNFAQHKLMLNLDIFNILNEQNALQTQPVGEAGNHLINNAYLQGIYFETPRYVRLSVSYDY